VPGRWLTVTEGEIVERRPCVAVAAGSGEVHVRTMLQDYSPTYAEAVSDGWEVA
jgi:hypothetical protein